MKMLTSQEKEDYPNCKNKKFDSKVFLKSETQQIQKQHRKSYNY